MDNFNLLESIKELNEVKQLNNEAITRIVTEVFTTVITKTFGTADNFDIIVNVERGDLVIYQSRTIVDDDFEEFDKNLHIHLSKAVLIEKDFVLGEEVVNEIKISSLERRHISSIKQMLRTKVTEEVKAMNVERYMEQIGEMVYGEVYQVLRKDVILHEKDGNGVYILPKSECMQKDYFKTGQLVSAVIKSVENEGSQFRVILSRTSSEYLYNLLVDEIPEIESGNIVVKHIGREVGFRSKVVVESYDDSDPIGLCVGHKGERVKSIMSQIQGEGIDFIQHSNNLSILVGRCLGLNNINVSETPKKMTIITNEVPMAIGKGGVNVRILNKMFGKKIDVVDVNSAHDDDVALDDFSDEIEDWIIEVLQTSGYNTAKEVLACDLETLEEKTDLEVETIEEVLGILRQEFA